MKHQLSTPLVAKKPHYIRTDVKFPSGSTVSVYFGRSVSTAIEKIQQLPLYDGVKVFELMEVFYQQGHKDGARLVFEKVDGLKSQIPHRNPGQPKKIKNKSIENWPRSRGGWQMFFK